MSRYDWLGDYLCAKPGAEASYKPEWDWLRYLVGGKQFAAVCKPDPKHEAHKGRLMVILKCEEDLAAIYRSRFPDVVPGFYSDKRTWNSVYLDGDVPDEVLRSMCDMSYDLVFGKLTKAERAKVTEAAAIKEEMKEYLALPCTFTDFFDMELTSGELALVCTAKKPYDPVKKYVPGYTFEIQCEGKRAGEIRLRIGFVESLYYAGNIGYDVYEPYRGHGYAEKACRMLIPLMKAHGMTRVHISNEEHNLPSKRTCEKLGARLLRVAEVPEESPLYAMGHKRENIFAWDFA